MNAYYTNTLILYIILYASTYYSIRQTVLCAAIFVHQFYTYDDNIFTVIWAPYKLWIFLSHIIIIIINNIFVGKIYIAIGNQCEWTIVAVGCVAAVCKSSVCVFGETKRHIIKKRISRWPPAPPKSL